MKHPFQAVVVRYVHDVLTGEFLNVGVVLLCPDETYVGARFISQWSRVTAAFPTAELPHLRRVSSIIQEACTRAHFELRKSLPLLPMIDVLQFLRGVIPPDDAGIQHSPVLRGITEDPERTLVELHQRYAEQHIPSEAGRTPRSDADVWQSFARRIASRIDPLHGFVPFTLQAANSGFKFEFERAWKNGVWNIAQPMSLDMLEPRAIRDKAALWTGRVIALHPSDQNAHIAFLVGMPPPGIDDTIQDAAIEAVRILSENLTGEAQVFTEERSEELAAKIERDLSGIH